jgi:hypothetical protein
MKFALHGWYVILTSFYVVLYFGFQSIWDSTLKGGANTGIVSFLTFGLLLNGKPASQWFVYGSLYTIAILSLGINLF